MASGGRFTLIDAGSLQYVVDQLCGRVLRVFGDKPVVEGGPFTLDDTGDDPRLLFPMQPDGGGLDLITDVLPWEVSYEATGDEPLITEFRFRGVACHGKLMFRKKDSFALTVDCLGGKPFQAQWFHRLAVACNGGIPTRLTCVLKYFMKYIGWNIFATGRAQVRLAPRIEVILEYFGVKPEHLRNSAKSNMQKISTAGHVQDVSTQDEYYSVTVVAMLLVICKLLNSATEGQDDGDDVDMGGASLELLRGLLMWPLRSTPTWGITVEGVDFLIQDGKLDLKMLRTSFEVAFKGRRYRRYPFRSPHTQFLGVNWCPIHGGGTFPHGPTPRPEIVSIRREASSSDPQRMYAKHFPKNDRQLGRRFAW